ncbi:hypothetical protein [Arthrobacter ipis]|uniref:hypothetical protein n=1 Tax=Arthrobacter ipis TaxID=2716202 RepID=UPI001C4A241E|nr:hypothetical protein [Arthrobacter ipis]
MGEFCPGQALELGEETVDIPGGAAVDINQLSGGQGLQSRKDEKADAEVGRVAGESRRAHGSEGF